MLSLCLSSLSISISPSIVVILFVLHSALGKLRAHTLVFPATGVCVYNIIKRGLSISAHRAKRRPNKHALYTHYILYERCVGLL